MSASLTIDGLDALFAQLSVPIADVLQDVTLAVGEEVKTRMEQYPPETAANSPRVGQYYVRGVGGMYQSKRTGQTHQTSTSEQLGSHWTLRADGGNAIVENDVSYAPWVQAIQQQSHVMAGIGWQTDQAVVGQMDATAQDIAETIITRALTP